MSKTSRVFLLRLLASVFALLFGGAPAAFGATLFSNTFNQPDGLITNEYAFWSPTDAAAAISPGWQLDSGSLFAQGNAAWSGVPDDCSNGANSPNAKSTNCTDSAIFRLNTKRFDFNNVKVSFSLFSNGLSSTASTPPVAWDGIHIFLRYQSEFQLYYASINRREQTSVIKKKCPGGTDNGGTYYELTPYVAHAWSPGSWQHISATVQTNPDNTVTIALYDDNGLVVQGTDTNVGKCAPITAAGAVGIRGDNNNFKLDDFLVTDLAPAGPPTTQPPTTPPPTTPPPTTPPPTAPPTAPPPTAPPPTTSPPPPVTLPPTTMPPPTTAPPVKKQAAPLPVIRHLSYSPVMPVNSTLQADADNAAIIHWQFTRRDRSKRGVLANAFGAADAPGASSIATASPVLQMDTLALATGDYSLDVTAENTDGVLSAAVSVELTLVSPDLSGIQVYPNPWRRDKHAAQQVTFARLTDSVRIRLFTLSGQLVKDLGDAASAATWDLTNASGDRVGSGIYLYLITNHLGQQTRGKLAVIR